MQKTNVFVIQNEFTNDGRGFEYFAFSNNTIITRDDLIDAANGVHITTAGAGNATLTGTGYRDNLVGAGAAQFLDGGEGNDTLEGHGGNDTLSGGNGDDHYIWQRGEGNDTINDQGASVTEVDRLKLVGISQNDVTLTRDGVTNNIQLVITNGSLSSSTLTMNDRLSATDSGKRIELIEFSDGFWTLDDILTKTTTNAISNTTTGTAYSDYLVGAANAEVLSGAAGDDKIDGGTGSAIDTLERVRFLLNRC